MTVKVAAVLLLLFLAGCTPAPEPTPPSPQADLSGVMHMPLIVTGQPCQNSPKKGLAAVNGADYLAFFCAGFYHDWGPSYGLRKISVLWCGWKNGHDYLTIWKQTVPANARINVYAINEPDRADQCAIGKAATATIMIEAMNHCPGCCFVGPGVSTAEGGQWVKDFITEFENQGGDLDRICAWSMHIYPNGTGWNVRKRLDVFCSFVPCDRPVWVTEVGWNKCNQTAADYNAYLGWLKELETDSRVARYFGYTVTNENCTFSSFLDGGGLTWIGKAFRNPAGAQPYP